MKNRKWVQLHNFLNHGLEPQNNKFENLIKVLKEFLTTNIDITTWRPFISVEDWTA